MSLKKILVRSFIGLLLLMVLLIGTGMLLIYIYRNEIKSSISDNVRKQYGLELKVEKVLFSFFSNWPEATIQLKNVELSSKLNKGPSENFVSAGAVFVSFNLRKLFHKELSVKRVSVKNAKIFLRKRLDGSRNYDMKPQAIDSTKSGGNFKLEMDKVVIRNTEFTFVNEQKRQRFNFTLNRLQLVFKSRQKGFQAVLDADVYVGGLIFKSNKGAFFKNCKLRLNLVLMHDKTKKQLCVYPPSEVEIAKQKYRLASLLNYSEEGKMYIWVENKKADLAEVNKVLNPKIQKVLLNFRLAKPVNANLLLGIALGKGREPILILNAESVNNNLWIGSSKVPYSKLSFKARIVSIAPDKKFGDPEKAFIRIDNISGNIYDFPFTAKVKVVGLKNSKIEIAAGIKILAEKIRFDFAKKLNMRGECVAKIIYSGPANKLNKFDFLSKEMDLKTELWFKNFYFQPKSNPYFFKLNGNASLSKEALNFTNLKVHSNGGILTVNGQADYFIHYLLGLKPGLRSRLNVYSESFDMGSYFQQKSRDKSVKRSHQKSLLTNDLFELQLAFAARHFKFNKLISQNAKIHIDYKRQVLYITSVKMDICEGSLTARGKLDNWQHLSSDMEVHNMNVSKLFEQMNNFGQESVKASNISGRLSLKASFKASMDEQKQVLAPSIQSEVKLKLTDGHLINFEPMQNISKHVFRNRDFKDITFTEINESFHLKDQTMKIEEMELASSVSNMYISGEYGFKGNSCINLLIPWSNLKHRGKDYVPKSSGQSAEDAKGVKLNFTGTPGKMKLSVGHCKPVHK